MPRPLAIFMFGYKGWGNATRQLIEAADAVESKRHGREPPVFVDVRIRRNVRAAGFVQNAFGKRLGPARYRWMPELGNLRVKQGRSGIEINHPEAAAELLQLAIDCAGQNRRVIYFCSCEFPCECHRSNVANLLLQAARDKRVTLQVVEWPGGEPESLELDIGAAPVPADHTSRLYLPKPVDLAMFAGLPLGSRVTVHGKGGESRTVLVAPAMYAPKGWYLPILQSSRGRVCPGTKAEANAWREWGGYNPRTYRTRR